MIGGNTSAVEKLCESQWPSLNNTSGEATTPNVVSSTVFDLLLLVFLSYASFIYPALFTKICELTNLLICVPNVDNLYLF